MATVEHALTRDPLLGAVAAPVRRSRTFRPAVVASSLFLGFIALAVLAPSLVAGESPLQVHLDQSFQAPSLHHLFGTDQSGRDVYARVIHGARESVLIGLGATALGLAIATVLGLVSGLGGRIADATVTRLLEVLFAFPGLLLALLFVAIFGTGSGTEIVAVALASAPGYARMIRGQVLAVKGSPYVEASLALGHPARRTIARTILPNAMRPLVVLATLGVGQSIVWASSLSFLGLGVAPPDPEWGAMLNAGRDYIQHAWWLDFFPGAVIVAFTLAATALGRYLQTRLEGRLER
ncbi:MAG TPA: ABC transporter permease [Baekduia sp.]|uniref:ABC transporter permease n=1 Tax=Baekduia sp. TaxID=2600305 RepID=UPI002C940E91|nr:ABC transporter permease [Baekduia sp.]HMJ34450.1 ABC transporter permease [Baekduia sp.]